MMANKRLFELCEQSFETTQEKLLALRHSIREKETKQRWRTKGASEDWRNLGNGCDADASRRSICEKQIIVAEHLTSQQNISFRDKLSVPPSL
jgi:hypothetical protein